MADSVLSFTKQIDKTLTVKGIQINEGMKTQLLTDQGKSESAFLEDYTDTEQKAIKDAVIAITAKLVKKADASSTITKTNAKTELEAKIEVKEVVAKPVIG